jgi:thymidylate kinase
MNKEQVFWQDFRITNVLNWLFVELKKQDIKYCVMNNYEYLPEKVANDVDIVIDKIGLQSLDKIMVNAAKNADLELTQKILHGYAFYTYILSSVKLNRKFRLQLDFFVDFSFKRLPILPGVFLLNGRRVYRNFFIPDAKTEVLFAILRRILKQDMNEKHMQKLNKLYFEHSRDIDVLFKEYFNKKMAKELITVVKTKKIDDFQKNIGKYRRFLKIHALKAPMVCLKYWISEIPRAISRFKYPIGMLVVFLGPDGSGKSTIAKRTLELASGSFHGEKLYYWRPGLFPEMGKLMRFWSPGKKGKRENPHPHAHKRGNAIKSLARFFFYMMDYIFGFYFKIYPQVIKKKLIIMDRYYYDFLVDLHRYRFNIPEWLPKFFLPCIPKPDMTFYLNTEPRDLLKRKQELTFQELDRQVHAFQNFSSMIPNFYSIDNSNRSIREVTSEVVSIILEKKVNQTRNILNLK